MKTTKRILATLLAVLMLATMVCTTAFAAPGTYSITIKNADGHSFEAYQIFKGDLSGRVLTNIEWGDGVDGSSLLAALKADAGLGSKFAACDSAAAVAKVMEGEWDNASTDAFAKVVSNHLIAGKKHVSTESGTNRIINGLDAGYYFIKDVTDVSAGLTGDAITKYLIKVTDDQEISPKIKVPTLTKEVYSPADETYTEAISANIGDVVTFRLTATLNARVNDYSEYYLQFVDTLPAGLVFEAVEGVYINSHKLDASQEYSKYEFVVDSSANPVTFTLAKAKTAVKEKTGVDVTDTDTVRIVFTAKVTEAIGINATTGNANEAVLKYSADPNNANVKGTTIPAIAKVYSYQLQITKVDAASPDTELEGAEFKLYRLKDSTKEYVQVDGNNKVTGWTADETLASTLVTDANGLVSVIGLAKDAYMIVETKAPETYNQIKDFIEVTFKAEFNKNDGTVDGFTASLVGKGVATLKETSEATGLVSIQITNSKGSTLPETGGIGTTIFYVVGIVLVLGAVALLIGKKRIAVK